MSTNKPLVSISGVINEIPAGNTLQAGISAVSLYLQNVAGTFFNQFVSTSTAVRTWTLPDKDGTVAMLDDTTKTGTVIAFAAAVASGYLLCDGSAKSRATYATLFAYLVTALGFTTQTFTVTIANPAVFTKSAHGFTGGERIRLSTTGALPTGLVNSVDYYVIYVSANTFQVSATFGGTVVATTGTQSGTHSYIQSLYGLGDGSTTFNVPDYRAQFLRGLDAGAGIDIGRALGTNQADMFTSHYHVVQAGMALAGAAGTAQAVLSGGVINSAATGGTETRPKNVAVNYGIKY
jgi:microcystin-dependent protein